MRQYPQAPGNVGAPQNVQNPGGYNAPGQFGTQNAPPNTMPPPQAQQFNPPPQQNYVTGQYGAQNFPPQNAPPYATNQQQAAPSHQSNSYPPAPPNAGQFGPGSAVQNSFNQTAPTAAPPAPPANHTQQPVFHQNSGFNPGVPQTTAQHTSAAQPAASFPGTRVPPPIAPSGTPHTGAGHFPPPPNRTTLQPQTPGGAIQPPPTSAPAAKGPPPLHKPNGLPLLPSQGVGSGGAGHTTAPPSFAPPMYNPSTVSAPKAAGPAADDPAARAPPVPTVPLSGISTHGARGRAYAPDQPSYVSNSQPAPAAQSAGQQPSNSSGSAPGQSSGSTTPSKSRIDPNQVRRLVEGGGGGAAIALSVSIVAGVRLHRAGTCVSAWARRIPGTMPCQIACSSAAGLVLGRVLGGEEHVRED